MTALSKLKNLFLHKEHLEMLHALDVETNQVKHDNTSSRIHAAIIKDAHVTSDVLMGDNVTYDLELLQNYHGESCSSDTIFYSLYQAKLSGSKFYFIDVLTKPVYNIDVLKQRQKVLLELEPKILQARELVKGLVKNETALLWIYESTQDELQSLYDMAYFKFWLLQLLNNQELVLTGNNLYKIIVSPLIGIVSPITYFIVPFYILKSKLKFNIGFTAYIKMMFNMLLSGSGPLSMFGGGVNKVKYISYAFTLLFYFQSLFNSVEVAKAVYKVCKLITEKTNCIINFIQDAKQLVDMCWNSEIYSVFFKDTQVEHLENLNCFEKETTRPFCLYSNFGRQLKIYKQFQKDKYIPLIKRVYMLDTLIGIIDAKNNLGLSYTVYTSKPDTMLKLVDVWHPCISKDRAVCNNITLGFNQPPNMILTGPNAGGKSTLIKSVLLSVIMSQTLTVANAKSCKMTPFYYINSHINIPDCKGKESLFEAEMYRSKSSLENLKCIENKPSIVVMDEIFNSTNPIEGIAGAYAIAKNMSEYKHNLSIISTHFVYMSKLAKELKDSFSAHKMNVVMDDTDNIQYPYKLSKGVSRQYIALELLKKNGFDASIIDKAMSIKKELLTLRSTENTDAAK